MSALHGRYGRDSSRLTEAVCRRQGRDRPRALRPDAGGSVSARAAQLAATRNLGQWGLPGGRLKDAEKPKACLRRELIEELGCRVPRLVRLGDWLHRNEQQRVFGCEIEKPIDTFDAEELRAIGWFSYEEVVELAAAHKLRMGFELAAIVEFRRHAANDADASC